MGKYTCDICETGFGDQFKFFEHLKIHYEGSPKSAPSLTDYEAANILLESSVLAPPPPPPDKSLDSSSLSGSNVTVYSHKGGRMHKKTSITVTKKSSQPVQSILCPICNRNFRKQKTFETHYQSCHNPQVPRAVVPPITKV